MKKYIIGLCALTVAGAFSSCNDWLSEETPGKTKLDDFFTSGEVAIQSVNAAYTPLAWEYNKSYFS